MHRDSVGARQGLFPAPVGPSVQWYIPEDNMSESAGALGGVARDVEGSCSATSCSLEWGEKHRYRGVHE